MSEIVRVAARGDGVAADGRHAAYAAPGDTLTEAGEVVPGPHHQTPPCRHFPTCGGCRLQHLDDMAWAGFLRDRIASALDAKGLQTEIREPHLSPPRSRRRATLHAEVHGKAVTIGFVEAASNRIVDMRECHILRPELFALVQPLRLLLRWLSGRRRVDVTMTLADQGVDLLLSGMEAGGLTAEETLTDFARAHRLARLSLDSGYGPEIRWEPRPVTITLSGVAVALPPAAFLQATVDGEAALIAGAREIVGDAQPVADLFTGLGTFALAIGGKVYAAEASRDAALALKAIAPRIGGQLFVDHRDLFRRPLTPTEAGRFGAIILDPPRAGAEAQVRELANAATGRMAYISCNPGTFARDAAILVAGGWRLDWVRPVGQFRWSTHVELVAAFTRPDSPPSRNTGRPAAR